MRWLIGVSLAVLVTCSIVSAASVAAEDSRPTTGFLIVDTTPVKGEVWVNGDYKGIAPVGPIEFGIITVTVSYGEVPGYEAPPPDVFTIGRGSTHTAIGRYTRHTDDENTLRWVLIAAAIVVAFVFAVAALVRAISALRNSRRG